MRGDPDKAYQDHLDEVSRRKCSTCGAQIQVIPFGHERVTFKYPCLCAKQPSDHPLIRVWYGILTDACEG